MLLPAASHWAVIILSKATQRVKPSPASTAGTARQSGGTGTQSLPPEIRPGQSIELLKALHILTPDGRLNQDSRRKLKQVLHLVQLLKPTLDRLLARAGYERVLAGDGEEAWEAIMAEPEGFDAFLLDINMPRLDGIGLLGRIKAHPALGGIPAVFQTGACSTEDTIVGLRAGASIIMCSPCCHKQIRPQLQLPAVLRPMLQHGIHLGQEAEMVTDSLRALLLESQGYDTQVFEFVALEHTSKNKMILAVKKSGAALAVAEKRRPEVLAQIAEIKRFYGLREQCLETLDRKSVV